MRCVSSVNYMWTNKRLKMLLMVMWITLEFSFRFVDVIHTVIYTENSAFITLIRAFTQTHSPYYYYYGI